MHSQLNARTRIFRMRRVLLTLACITIIIPVILASSMGDSRMRPAAETAAEPTPAATAKPAAATGAQTPPALSKIRAITVKVTAMGFEPAEITVPPGQYSLGVYNRSGLCEVSLRLDREAGPRLHDVQVPSERLDWRALVDLQPGKYMLTEATQPEWSCTINVSAK